MKIASIAAAIPLACFCTQPQAQEAYPTRPVTLIHGFATGANVDTVARAIGTYLGPLLNQTVLVDARPGAGSTIASAAVARAKPDGYTLLLGTGSHTVAGASLKNLPYDTVKSFSYVSSVATFPNAIIVSGASPYHNLNDLIAAARANPGKLNYGSAGQGSTPHMGAALFASVAKIDVQHIPYKGFSPALTAILAKDIDFFVPNVGSVVGPSREGQIRVLAITAPKRWSRLPTIPTAPEQGININVSSWTGIMGPLGLPDPIVDRLNAETQKLLKVPGFVKIVGDLGGDSAGSTPAEMAQMVSNEVQQWVKVIRDAHIEMNE